MRFPLPRNPWTVATRWHVDSQQTARHNALVATTALAERRRERVEVEEYLERLVTRRNGRVLEARVHASRTGTA